MFFLVPLFAVAALVPATFARVDAATIELQNKLLPNEIKAAVPAPKFDAARNRVRISTPPPQEAVFVPGTSLVLECEMSGNPTPFAVWLKNGVTVSDFEQESNEVFPVNPISPARLISRYVIRSAFNGDVFTCVANAGTAPPATASTTVIVKGDDSASLLSQLIPSKPVVTTYYRDAFQIEGNSATLPCRAFSTTKTQVTWLDTNNRILYGNNRITVLPSGDLHISDINWSDMGMFTCVVRNAFGKDVAQTFFYVFGKEA